MPVRPTTFAADGGCESWHDEMNHGGPITAVNVRFGRRDDGTNDPLVLVLSCPVAGCGGNSTHPASGGAMPAAVQKLFLRVALRRPAAYGIPVGQRTLAGTKAFLRALVEAESPGRFRLDAMTSEDDLVDG